MNILVFPSVADVIPLHNPAAVYVIVYLVVTGPLLFSQTIVLLVPFHEVTL